MTILFEYGSVDLEITRSQAEALQATTFVDVSPLAGDRWRVTASSHVGSLVAGGLELLIRPKINPENLFLLLEPGLPPNAWRDEAFEYSATSDLLPSIIVFFARTVETTLGRGVLRAYETRSEALTALRGRLDVTRQFTRGGVMTPVAVTYDDFSENVAENRALRAAVRLALRVPRVAPRERQRLMRQMVALEGADDVPIRPEAIDAIPITRLNQHYAPALGLARLLLSNLSLVDVGGHTAASSFMVDMNDLFQRFMTDRLRRALRGSLDVIDEPTVHLGVGHRVPMKPDLVLRGADGRLRYVGDLKYKLASDARARSSDYYQLLAYTSAMDLPEGVLVYCRRLGDPEQATVTVRNSGKRLVVRAINLAGSPSDVEDEVQALAASIRRDAAACG